MPNNISSSWPNQVVQYITKPPQLHQTHFPKQAIPLYTVHSPRNSSKLSVTTTSSNWSHVFPSKLSKTSPIPSLKMVFRIFQVDAFLKHPFISRLNAFISLTFSYMKTFLIYFISSAFALWTHYSLSISALKRHPSKRWSPSYEILPEPARSKLVFSQSGCYASINVFQNFTCTTHCGIHVI